jgi:hypothetical protein
MQPNIVYNTSTYSLSPKILLHCFQNSIRFNFWFLFYIQINDNKSRDVYKAYTSNIVWIHWLSKTKFNLEHLALGFDVYTFK